jgi:hypothetical protein
MYRIMPCTPAGHFQLKDMCIQRQKIAATMRLVFVNVSRGPLTAALCRREGHSVTKVDERICIFGGNAILEVSCSSAVALSKVLEVKELLAESFQEL